MKVFPKYEKDSLYFLFKPSEFGWFTGLMLISINCFDLSADSNSGHIDFEQGLAFQRGDGVSQDWSAARKKYQEASASGNHNGSHHLGLMFRHGDGVDKNLTTAVSWMVKAAEQGSSDAMNDLGVYYKDGLGLDQNYTRAASWFRKGAELGNAFAKFNLALLHTSGLGVEIDLNKSTKLEHKWLLAFYHPEQHKITNRKIIWKKIKASCMYQHGYLLYV